MAGLTTWRRIAKKPDRTQSPTDLVSQQVAGPHGGGLGPHVVHGGLVHRLNHLRPDHSLLRLDDGRRLGVEDLVGRRVHDGVRRRDGLARLLLLLLVGRRRMDLVDGRVRLVVARRVGLVCGGVGLVRGSVGLPGPDGSVVVVVVVVSPSLYVPFAAIAL